jgi:hypothetical protein
MSHFNESLYLRKEIQRLHEENMKLKRYLYEMQIQQDAGSLMVPEVSTTPDTYVPELKQDNTTIMMDKNDPPELTEDEMKLIYKSLSLADITRILESLKSRGHMTRLRQLLRWLRFNRNDPVFDPDGNEIPPPYPPPIYPSIPDWWEYE